MSEEEKPFGSVNDLISKRKPDPKLWEEVKRLSEGDNKGKLQAVNLAFDKYYELPKEVDKLLLELVRTDQPEDIRVGIAEKMAMGAIPLRLYLNLLQILREDPNPKVKEIVEKENERWKETMKPLRDASEAFAKITSEVANRFASIEIPRFEIPIVNMFAFLSESNKFNEQLARVVANISPSYYLSNRFLEIPELVRAEEHENPLISKLRKCPSGKESWSSYQEVCEDILEYLFVPPLNQPFKQEPTETGLQIRDLIFDIPYDADGFWYWIKVNHYSSGVIVECKNYSKLLLPNELTITSKYFGRKRCGLFGIVVCRAGISESARKEQARLWTEDEKMIVCLDDSDLIKMILLKDQDEEPEVLIDGKIMTIRRSLE